jgi:glycerol-3-phosphate dehydrogenase
MLKHMLHATTMNRDGDPAASDSAVDFAAFDAGETAPAAARGTTGDDPDRAATDGGRGGENADS